MQGGPIILPRRMTSASLTAPKKPVHSSGGGVMREMEEQQEVRDEDWVTEDPSDRKSVV